MDDDEYQLDHDYYVDYLFEIQHHHHLDLNYKLFLMYVVLDDYHQENVYENFFYLIDLGYFDNLNYDTDDLEFVEVNQILHKHMELLVDVMEIVDQFEHHDH